MRKQTIFVGAGVISLAVASFAFAQTPNVKPTVAKQRVAALKAENAVKKCEIITDRVKNKIDVFEENKEKHLTSYAKTKTKIEKFIERLEDKGYETSKIKEDLIGFDSKVTKFSNDYDTYISLLNDTKQYTCSRSEGEFKVALRAARDQLKIVHEDAVEIRTFFAKTVRPHILEIKDQKPKTEETTEVEND